MDYNIEPGIDTELNTDSVGEGLLGHERAYLAWLDSVFARYPDLIIENCSSGGLRIDYAMLQRYSIQSTSDQEDYRRNLSGKGIITGQHTQTTVQKELKYIEKVTGKLPALCGFEL